MNKINAKMGTIKIELDLPNFEKELELRVVLNKDGVQSSTPPIKVNPETSPIWKQVPDPYPQQPSIIPTITCVNSKNANSNAIVGKPADVVTYGSNINENTQNTQAGSKIPSSMMGNY